MMTLSPTRPTLAMSTPALRDVMPTPDSGGRRGDGVTRQTLARANGLAVDEARLGFAAAADAGAMRSLTLTLTLALTLTMHTPTTAVLTIAVNLALARAPTLPLTLTFTLIVTVGTMRPLTAANAVKQQQQRNDAQPG